MEKQTTYCMSFCPCPLLFTPLCPRQSLFQWTSLRSLARNSTLLLGTAHWAHPILSQTKLTRRRFALTLLGLSIGKKVCLLQQIKPEQMADPEMLWEFCKSLAPINDVKLNETGKVLKPSVLRSP